MIAAVIFTLAGCAGSGLNRTAVNNELPKELTKELQERYTVRDSSVLIAPTPLVTSQASTPSGGPVVASGAEKKGKGKKSKTLTKKDGSSASIPKAAGIQALPVPTAVDTFVYPSRRPKIDPLWVGEKQVFEVTYFGVPAGEFTAEVLDHKAVDGRKVYHIMGRAQTSSVFALFYKLDDMVETFMDYEGLFAHRFHILLDETKQKRDSLEIYDSKKRQTFYWNRWDRPGRPYEETKDFQEMPPFPQDSFSALFYARGQDLSDGRVFTFPVVSEGRHWEAVVSVVRRETISTALGQKKAVVLKPEMSYQGILKKQGDSFMWLSDDDRRLLLRIEAKVKIGTVVATLKKFEPGTPPTTSASAESSRNTAGIGTGTGGVKNP